MGHIRTPKFELQLEQLDKSVLVTGVNSIKEAKKEIQALFDENCTGKCFLWGNSQAGKTYLDNKGADYYFIDANTLKIEACAI